MGCRFLLQGIFLTQGLKLGLLHCRQILYRLSHLTHGSLQARVLEWVAVSFSRGSSPPRDGTHVSCILAGGFFTTVPVVFTPPSCLTLCDPVDCSPPGSSVPCSSPGGLPDPTIGWTTATLAIWRLGLYVFSPLRAGVLSLVGNKDHKRCVAKKKKKQHFFSPQRRFSLLFLPFVSTWEGRLLPFSM